MGDFFTGMIISFIITWVFVLSIIGTNKVIYEDNPETSSEYREGYCKALNGDRIEGTLCVDKENKTLYIFKTDYEK